MLKNCIIGPGYPLRGGISESNQALQKAFCYNKNESIIVSYSLQYPKILFPGKQQVIDNFDDKLGGVTQIINTLNPLSWFKTAKYIIKEKPDYVIVRYWHPYFAICLAFICRILKKRSLFIIAWIDNIEPHESVPFQKYFTSFFLCYCDAFLVMSKSVKSTLTTYYQSKGKKIITSPHPIYDVFGKAICKHDARIKIGVQKKDVNSKYILFFGLVRQYKGLDLLLDVMATQKIKDLNIKLIIAGEFYDSKDKYISKIEFLNIHNSVLLYDFYIPNEDVVNYFCASDIVVQPYRSATQSGVSMIAYNFNKPMILTNVGGLSDYVSHGQDGYLVDVKVEAIVASLVDFYQFSREDKFVQAIKQKKSRYSWSSLCDNFNKLYEDEKKK